MAMRAGARERELDLVTGDGAPPGRLVAAVEYDPVTGEALTDLVAVGPGGVVTTLDEKRQVLERYGNEVIVRVGGR